MLANDHTRLINRFIGLCTNTEKWPSTLYDIGYSVQLIEQVLKLRSGGAVVPDVVAVSSKHNHILVVDCKSGGNIDHDQDTRYTQLTSDVLFRIVDVREPLKTNHKFCYADTETHHENLKLHTTHPFVTFGVHTIKGEGDFGDQQTNMALCSTTSLDGMREPTNLYPFSHSDDNDLIAFYVLQGLVSRALKKSIKRSTNNDTLAVELLEKTHTLFKTLGAEHKKQLIKKINEILGLFNGNKKFDEYMRKINDDDVSIHTLQKFLGICEEMMVDIKKKTRITEFIN